MKLQSYIPTIEDTFTVMVDTDKGTKEMIVLVDTAGSVSGVKKSETLHD